LNGLFITFEGGEGAGKSTQIARLADRLRTEGRDVVTTREPGGSPGAEAIRHVILSGAAERGGVRLEALLFAAARNDHLEQLIRPALRAGKIVLCDRFVDSSRVYQGAGGGLDPAFLKALEHVTIGATMPDLTIILDIDPVEGLRRADIRRGTASADRFEKERLEVHARRRASYLDIAAHEPDRCKVIDASRPADDIAADIFALVESRLAESETRVQEDALVN